MDNNEIISSGLLESYVLGRATPQEVAMIQAACAKDPLILKEIEQIEESLLDFSKNLGQALPSALKEKIGSQLKFAETKNKDAKVVTFKPDAKEKVNLYKFGIAASLLLFVTSVAYNVLLQRRLNSVNNELVALSESRTYMAEEMQIQKASLNTIKTQLNVIADPQIKTIALEGMNSLKDQSALVHWNTKTQEVYFNASLPLLPTDKQYQLWAIVDGKPVDMGMIGLQEKDSIFLKMKTTGSAEAFAVTIEKAGGSVSPTMETMCLMGKV